MDELQKRLAEKLDWLESTQGRTFAAAELTAEELRRIIQALQMWRLAEEQYSRRAAA